MSKQVKIAIHMADTYIGVLKKIGVQPQQIKDITLIKDGKPVTIKAHSHLPVRYYRLRHVMWMAEEVKNIAAEGNIAKAQRWLGFIQGVLWGHELRTVEELRKDNQYHE